MISSLLTSGGTQANSKKPRQGKFMLDIRKRFFSQRMAGHWDRLLREWPQHKASQISRGACFKKGLDNTLRCTRGFLDQDLWVLVCPFQLRVFHASVNV